MPGTGTDVPYFRCTVQGKATARVYILSPRAGHIGIPAPNSRKRCRQRRSRPAKRERNSRTGHTAVCAYSSVRQTAYTPFLRPKRPKRRARGEIRFSPLFLYAVSAANRLRLGAVPRASAAACRNAAGARQAAQESSVNESVCKENIIRSAFFCKYSEKYVPSAAIFRCNGKHTATVRSALCASNTRTVGKRRVRASVQSVSNKSRFFRPFSPHIAKSSKQSDAGTAAFSASADGLQKKVSKFFTSKAVYFGFFRCVTDLTSADGYCIINT